MGSYQLAHNDLETVIRLYAPYAPLGHAYKAKVEAMEKKWQRAVDEATIALKMAPGLPLALQTRAEALTQLGMLKEAEQDFAILREIQNRTQLNYST